MRTVFWESPTAPIPFFQRPANTSLSVAIGVFDGVHRGHQRLLDRTADAPGAIPSVLTFATNPAAVTRSSSFLGNLSTLDGRLALFGQAGVQFVVVINFSHAFAALTGSEFVAAFLERTNPVAKMVVGFDFHLGKGRDTHAIQIEQMLEPQGVRVDIVPPLKDNGEPISSSRVRRLVIGGDLEGAARLLGRPYAFWVSERLPERVDQAFQILPKSGTYRACYIGEKNSRTGMVRIEKNGQIRWDYPEENWQTIEILRAV